MRRRPRFLLLLVAHVALLGILAQAVAVDHWRTRVEDVRGIEGSHAHSSHCHGNTASCSDSAGATALAVVPHATLPGTPPTLSIALRPASRRRRSPSLRKLPRPPRAA